MPQKQGIQLNKYTPDYVVFDLETTGISRTFDEVVEISAVKVRSGQVVDEFSTLVNPGRHIPAGASQVNGITDQMVADCPLFSQVLQEFLNFTEGLTLVGHNIASFDMKFIWRDAEKYYGELVPNDYVDTLKVARRHLSELPRHRLVDLAEYYGISPEGAHRALNDCRMNQQVYERMVAEMRKKRAIQHEYIGRKAETDNTGASKTEGNAADRNGIAKQSAKPAHPIGYGLSADADLMEKIRDVIQPWSVSIPALVLAKEE